MFDSIRNSKRIVQVFLLLITVPFALWGVEAYLRDGGQGAEVAKVGGSKITAQEFEDALRNQQDRLRRSFGPDFDPKMLNTPEARKAVLDGLINQRALARASAEARLGVTDEQLRQIIASAPALQENGQFSQKRYEAFVRSQNLTEAGFEAKLRQDLVQQQLLGAVGESALVSSVAQGRWAATLTQEREVSVLEFKADDFAKQVKLAADAAKKFYDANPKHFQTREQVRAQYVVLSREALAKKVKVSEDEIKKWYDTHADRYAEPEQRRASHILIAVDAAASADQLKAAKARAEAVLKEVQAAPAEFAKIARAQSQDPGSKESGGDLGFFGRGSMVKPFEDATFSLKENEISGLVRSDFGFHIIKLTAIKAGKKRSFAEARNEIAAELQAAAAAKLFAESSEAFNNLVFEQADSLKPAAEKFGLAIAQTDWFARGDRGNWPLSNPKLAEALFSDDVVKNKRNSEVVDVGGNTLVAARALEYRPAKLRPFEEVKSEIEAGLVRDESVKLARQAGEKALAELQKGGAGANLTWAAPRKVSRMTMQGMPPEIGRTVFGMPTDKLPAYAGLATPRGGYILFRLSSVTAGKPLEAPQLAGLQRQYERMMGEEDVASFVSALRANTKVVINPAALAAKEK